MRFLKSKKGFTIVELIIALNLLGIVSLATGSYISNSFKESNQVATKVEIQTSVTALMNDLKTTIKTANIPVLDIISENSNIKEYRINQLKSGNIIPLNIKFNKNSHVVTINNDIYELIEDVTLEKVDGNNGAKIEIIGMGNKYSLTSTYYTRNTITGCAHEWSEITQEFVFPTCTENGSQKYQCIKCGETKLDILPMSEHILSDWLYNSDQHWKKCLVCNNEVEGRENHTITDNRCTICGYKESESNVHTHNWTNVEIVKDATCTQKGQAKYTCSCGETKIEEISINPHTLSWATNEERHYMACEICGYIESQGEHKFSYATNEEKHYLACEECGYIKNQEEHVFSYARNNEKHYLACEICGYIESQEEHVFSYATNEVKHYFACEECGYIVNQAEHIFNYAKNGDKHYWACEECGYIVNSEPHMFSFAKSDTKHYWACEDCGYIVNSGEHEYDWAINGNTHYFACKICGHISNSGIHEYNWAINEEKHYMACETCGYISSESEHHFKNNKCIDCGYSY